MQTSLPDNPTIALAASQNYTKFYEEEIGVRQMFHYPPFSSLAKLTFSGTDTKETRQAAETWRKELIQLLPSEFELHAIVPAGHAKIKDKFRFQLLMRGPAIYPISRALSTLKQSVPLPRGVYVLIDINPTSTFF